MGPGITQRVDGGIDHHTALILDAQRCLLMHFADFLRAHVVLSRSRENDGKFIWGDGDDGAGAAFAEEGLFRGERTVSKLDVCAKTGRNTLRPYKERRRGKAGFGGGDG